MGVHLLDDASASGGGRGRCGFLRSRAGAGVLAGLLASRHWLGDPFRWGELTDEEKAVLLALTPATHPAPAPPPPAAAGPAGMSPLDRLAFVAGGDGSD